MTTPFRIADHRHGPRESTRTVPVSAKVSLLLVYDLVGELAELTIVRKKKPADRRIFFDWRNGLHALKTRQGVGGLQYVGVVAVDGGGGSGGGSGTVFDDDAFVNADGTPWRASADDAEATRPQSLDEWIGYCLDLLRA